MSVGKTFLMPPGMKGDAAFSHESPPLFRYVLKRSWPPRPDAKGRVLIIGHNPSDAGKHRNDPTISKVCKFALTWGYNEVLMHNLMDRIADKPENLPLHPHEQMTSRNTVRVMQCAHTVDRIVCAWGLVAPAFKLREASMVAALRAERVTLYCIDTNADGSPKHPLYIEDDTPLKLWEGYHAD